MGMGLQDLRYAIRFLWTHPSFTAASVLTGSFARFSAVAIDLISLAAAQLAARAGDHSGRASAGEAMMAAKALRERTLGDLLGKAAGGYSRLAITDLTLDSRAVRPGAAFVALRGGYTIDTNRSHCKPVLASDEREADAQLSKKWRRRSSKPRSRSRSWASSPRARKTKL